MNLPNKITLFRFFLIPVFTVIFLLDNPVANTVALVVFCVACASDFLDGYIARKNRLITDFGKLMDPLADKLLVCIALICFVQLRENFPCWCAIVIITREFIISGFRQLAAEKGTIISAGMWGKTKTVVQMFLCIFYIWDLDYTWFRVTEEVFMYSATVLTIISLLDYIIRNRNIIKNASK